MESIGQSITTIAVKYFKNWYWPCS